MSGLLHLEKSYISRDLGDECFQPSLGLTGELCVCSPSFSSLVLSKFLVEHVTSHYRLYSSGTLLGEGSLASHISQHVSRCLSLVSHIRGLHHSGHSPPFAQGSAVSAFNHLAAQSVSSDRGESNIYAKGITAVLEGMGWVVCSRGCTKQCHFCP